MRPCWNDADQDAASNRFGISEVARLSGLPFVDFESDSNARKGMALGAPQLPVTVLPLCFGSYPGIAKRHAIRQSSFFLRPRISQGFVHALQRSWPKRAAQVCYQSNR